MAVAGCRSSSRRTAAEERCLMISSMYLPINTKAITTADTSKYTPRSSMPTGSNWGAKTTTTL
ncbi:hypothetical protein [Cyanobium sp. FACHB-13342]|uniref:hypothetical protein n=1 Tax=Cyanobium sp. FACHB-13342 TaxID=2692793 RepID=UPI001F549E85|nr:hypothetical protein [Cyanobium sp. FACHB-13342]